MLPLSNLALKELAIFVEVQETIVGMGTGYFRRKRHTSVNF